ncbi:hypothetical protein H9639_01535 [Arthrobacter sp. Sa2CUA1]|uniref:Lipoprotein n=1 Tax=Arthrobacter gallicola TaxID=2762225 RepID=A0ABR8UN50_9MICC|nr:hypothetical protein [Arthrobacter gallicola]MBD7993980.1 hypothetical protein [Arthrobacter gallicola]
MGKLALRWIAACSVMFLVSACGAAYGAPDREENFTVQGRECSARWWLEPLADEVPDEASSVASHALTNSVVSPAELEEWKATILESQSGDKEIPNHRLESYAYVEAVRADVRSELDAAGYPDAPTRLIEVYSDSDCS